MLSPKPNRLKILDTTCLSAFTAEDMEHCRMFSGSVRMTGLCLDMIVFSFIFVRIDRQTRKNIYFSPFMVKKLNFPFTVSKGTSHHDLSYFHYLKITI